MLTLFLLTRYSTHFFSKALGWDCPYEKDIKSLCGRCPSCPASELRISNFSFIIHWCMETFQSHAMQHHSWLRVTSGLHRQKEVLPWGGRLCFSFQWEKELTAPQTKTQHHWIVYFKPQVFFPIFLYFIISFWAISIQTDRRCPWWNVHKRERRDIPSRVRFDYNAPGSLLSPRI